MVHAFRTFCPVDDKKQKKTEITEQTRDNVPCPSSEQKEEDKPQGVHAQADVNNSIGTWPKRARDVRFVMLQYPL